MKQGNRLPWADALVVSLDEISLHSTHEAMQYGRPLWMDGTPMDGSMDGWTRTCNRSFSAGTWPLGSIVDKYSQLGERVK